MRFRWLFAWRIVQCLSQSLPRSRQPIPRNIGRDAKNLCYLAWFEFFRSGEQEDFSIGFIESLEPGSDVSELRRVMSVSASGVPLPVEALVECQSADTTSTLVGEDPAGDAIEPRELLGSCRSVLDAPPGNEERLRRHVDCIVGVGATSGVVGDCSEVALIQGCESREACRFDSHAPPSHTPVALEVYVSASKWFVSGKASIHVDGSNSRETWATLCLEAGNFMDDAAEPGCLLLQRIAGTRTSRSWSPATAKRLRKRGRNHPWPLTSGHLG